MLFGYRSNSRQICDRKFEYSSAIGMKRRRWPVNGPIKGMFRGNRAVWRVTASNGCVTVNAKFRRKRRNAGGSRSRKPRRVESCRTAIYRFGARAQPDRWLCLTFTIVDSPLDSLSLSFHPFPSTSRRRFLSPSPRAVHRVRSPLRLPSLPFAPRAHARALHSRPLLSLYLSFLFFSLFLFFSVYLFLCSLFRDSPRDTNTGTRILCFVDPRGAIFSCTDCGGGGLRRREGGWPWRLGSEIPKRRGANARADPIEDFSLSGLVINADITGRYYP